MTPREQELDLQLGAANAELRAQAKEIEALKADTDFDHLAGRGMHELRFDELVPYLQSLAVNYGPSSTGFIEAANWIVKELERKTNEERVANHYINEYLAAPTPATVQPAIEQTRVRPLCDMLHVRALGGEMWLSKTRHGNFAVCENSNGQSCGSITVCGDVASAENYAAFRLAPDSAGGKRWVKDHRGA